MDIPRGMGVFHNDLGHHAIFSNITARNESKLLLIDNMLAGFCKSLINNSSKHLNICANKGDWRIVLQMRVAAPFGEERHNRFIQ